MTAVSRFGCHRRADSCELGTGAGMSVARYHGSTDVHHHPTPLDSHGLNRKKKLYIYQRKVIAFYII